jgi:hypothetical protein
MKAKIARKGLGSVQDSPVPAECEVRITKTKHKNGDHADAAEVLYELSGELPLKNDDFVVVLADNVKCMSNLFAWKRSQVQPHLMDRFLDA